MGAVLHLETPCLRLPKARALVMLGPPGAGKGTQSRAVAGEFRIPDISTGEMLREAVREKTALGLEVKSVMEAGGLVPDELVSGMVEERTLRPDCARGFILDGFPRNLEQALFLDRMLQKQERDGALVVNIIADTDALLRRLTGREICPVCGSIYNVYLRPPQKPGFCDKDGAPLTRRNDDSQEVIRKRLKEYEAQTRPMLDHYREMALLHDVDGSQEPSAVTANIFRLVEG
ncbi:MAG: adenylate kinase [Terriglobia bacterium]